MKPRTDIAHQGTIGKKNRVGMSFDENSLAHLMSVLTDLYSDPELAVIREYSTNACDSHIDAKNPDPIQIELPTSLRRVFVVRDFGLGMSEKDVTENFSKYGWSSKRDTDEQVGMLGLGCKSALTYSSQFTFIATKDGIQSTVLVTRDESGAGALQIMGSQKVNRPNGVEVQIPVKGDIAAFNEKATKFFRYWDPGTVLINGNPTKSLWDPKVQTELGVTVLDDGLLITPNEVLDSRGYRQGAVYNNRTGQYELPGKHVIVMGNVPYPVSEPLSEILSGAVVARVPVGAVNFTPSREQLQDTAMTKETIREIKEHVRAVTIRAAQADVAAGTDPFDALQRYNKWMRLANNNLNAPLLYKNAPIPKKFKNDTERTMSWSNGYYHSGALDVESRASRYQSEISTLGLDEKTLCVTNHKAKQIAKGTKQRIIKHIEAMTAADATVTINRVYLTDGDPFGDWVKHKVSLEDLQQYAVPSTPRKVQANTWRLVQAGGTEKVVSSLDDSVIKVIVPAGDGTGVRAAVGSYLHNRTDAVGVIIGSNRVDSFKKKQKNAMTLAEFAAHEAKAYNKSITPLESHFNRVVPSSVSAFMHTFGKIDKSETLDDKEIQSVIDKIQAIDTPSLTKRFTELARVLYYASRSYWRPADASASLTTDHKSALPFFEECKMLTNKYPLLRFSMSSREAAQYINMTHYYHTNRKVQ